jgi:hypothetical protein
MLSVECKINYAIELKREIKGQYPRQWSDLKMNQDKLGSQLSKLWILTNILKVEINF